VLVVGLVHLYDVIVGRSVSAIDHGRAWLDVSVAPSQRGQVRDRVLVIDENGVEVDAGRHRKDEVHVAAWAARTKGSRGRNETLPGSFVVLDDEAIGVQMLFHLKFNICGHLNGFELAGPF